jgi:hypothetical protein
LAVALLATANCNEAQAQQFLVRGPDGSLGISNFNGTYTYIHPERLNPGAGNAMPGTTQWTPNGMIWQGQDGMTHGNLVDPWTGDIHVKSHRPGRGVSQGVKPTVQRPSSMRTGPMSRSFPSRNFPRW